MSAGPRVCAFCGRDGKMTQEHVWPTSIIKRLAGKRASYSERVDSLFWSDMTIGDVCASCNGGPLSALDVYGAAMFDRYFAQHVIDDAPVAFDYDFDMLARWLLKLSYNSARVVGSDDVRLGAYRDWIRGATTARPQDFSIAVDLVLPSESEASDPWIPATNRLCRVQTPDDVGYWCTVRLVAINSYYFWILMQDIPDNEIHTPDALAMISLIRGVGLDPDGTSALLTGSGARTASAHEDWARVMDDRGMLP